MPERVVSCSQPFSRVSRYLPSQRAGASRPVGNLNDAERAAWFVAPRWQKRPPAANQTVLQPFVTENGNDLMQSACVRRAVYRSEKPFALI